MYNSIPFNKTGDYGGRKLQLQQNQKLVFGFHFVAKFYFQFKIHVTTCY